MTTSRGALMKSPFVFIAMVAVCSAQLLWASPEAAAQPAQSGQARYGTVHFPISCRPGVQEQFERAVAMLFDPRTLGRLDSLEPGRGESLARVRGQECSRYDGLAGAARAGFHGIRVSAA